MENKQKFLKLRLTANRVLFSYFPNTKCPVLYKSSDVCKDGFTFSCSSFDLPNQNSKRCTKGEKLVVGKKA